MVYHCPASDNAYQRQVFARDRVRRLETIEILERDVSNDAKKIAAKLVKCCQNPIVNTIDGSDDIVVHEQTCKSRCCPRCSRTRAYRLIARIMPLIDLMSSPRFITLTVAHAETPLIDQVKHLRQAFARLRRTKEWKRHIQGGITTIEIKWIASTQQWHPHLHVICDGTYWKQKRIKALWEHITGDSSIVDIRFVHNRDTAAHYVAKYAAKSSDLEYLPFEKIGEWALCIHAMRMAQTFGTSHGVKIESEDLEDRPAITRVGDIATIIHAADAGNAIAAAIVTAIFEYAQIGRPIAGKDPDADLAIETAGLLARIRTWKCSHPQGQGDGDRAPPRSARRTRRDVDRGAYLWTDDGGVPDTKSQFSTTPHR